jgi:hypothetical protein
MVGLVILACFSAIWAVAGLVQMGLGALWYALPVAISALLLWGTFKARGGFAVPTDADKARIDRLVSIWSAVEGVAIFVATNIEGNTGRSAWIMATISLIVGLHFIPLARGLPMSMYYSTGGALIALAAAGFLNPGIATPGLIGVGAAMVLWVTILWALRQAFARLGQGATAA